MIQFSYTKSPRLAQKIEHIDSLRTQLLLTPLSIKDQTYLQWKNTIKSIHSLLQLENIFMAEPTLEHVLAFQTTRQLTKDEKFAVQLKNVYSNMYFDWYGKNKTIELQHIADLLAQLPRTEIQEKESYAQALTYTQAYTDHPLIQAALAEITAVRTPLTSEHSFLSATLVHNMFLYKHCYDFKRFISISEYYNRSKAVYTMLLQKAIQETNVTEWIEFVLDGYSDQLQKLFRTLASLDYDDLKDTHMLALNDRQKNILSLIERPGSKISNKDVQKQFKVSPITAARDLTKLATLSFIYPIGKGRSTYYTKV